MKKIALKSIMFLFMAIFTGITFFACNDDDEKEERKISDIEIFLKGTSWSEIDGVLDDGVLDTIWFKTNGTVQDKTGIFSNNRYSIINDSTISFINDSCTYEFRFSISHNNDDYEITFYNFINRSITQVVKNITYKKIN